MKESILVVVAHADDEVLGCGGTIARHTEAGDEVSVLFMTDGVGSRIPANSSDAARRRAAMERAMGRLGVTRYENLDFPDNALDTVPLLEITQSVESFCKSGAPPHTVLTHYPGDLNVDHEIVHRAVMTCFRPQPRTNAGPQLILDFEVLSSTGWYGVTAFPGFHPNFYCDISSTLQQKLDALAVYGEEMRPWPHARSIDALQHLAKFRGAMVGIEAAEAFIVERLIH